MFLLSVTSVFSCQLAYPPMSTKLDPLLAVLSMWNFALLPKLTIVHGLQLAHVPQYNLHTLFHLHLSKPLSPLRDFAKCFVLAVLGGNPPKIIVLPLPPVRWSTLGTTTFCYLTLCINS